MNSHTDFCIRSGLTPTQRALLALLVILTTFSLLGCVGVIGTGVRAANSTSGAPSFGALAASATNLSFGNVGLGQSSVLGVTIANTGNSNVTIANVSISGSGYAVSGVFTGEILTPGQTTSVNVIFTPAGTGIQTGAVRVTGNATNSPAMVSLSGAGVPQVSHVVTLTWTASTSMVSGYNVYRSSFSGGPYTKLNPALITTLQYIDPNVQSGQTYFYVATSMDSSDLESMYSDQVSAAIPPP